MGQGQESIILSPRVILIASGLVQGEKAEYEARGHIRSTLIGQTGDNHTAMTSYQHLGYQI